MTIMQLPQKLWLGDSQISLEDKNRVILLSCCAFKACYINVTVQSQLGASQLKRENITHFLKAINMNKENFILKAQKIFTSNIRVENFPKFRECLPIQIEEACEQ